MLHYGDLTDSTNLIRIIQQVQHDEIYKLGFTHETQIFQADKKRALRTSAGDPPEKNKTFNPRSPYGVAKIYGYWVTVNYRRDYSMHACKGTLFNLESRAEVKRL